MEDVEKDYEQSMHVGKSVCVSLDDLGRTVENTEAPYYLHQKSQEHKQEPLQ